MQDFKKLENDLILSRDLDLLEGEVFLTLDERVDLVRRKLISFIRTISGS